MSKEICCNMIVFMNVSVALITGGTRGIGFATALKLKEFGISTVVCSRTAPIHNEPGLDYIICDVSIKTDVAQMFARIKKNYGHLDILVNNAAHMKVTKLEEVCEEDAELTMRTNVYGAMFCMQEALPILSRNGIIINLISSCVEGGRNGQSMYGASKAALSTMSDCFALEIRDANKEISVVKVMPRRTMTGMRLQNFPNEDHEDCLQPEDVASVIATIAKSRDNNVTVPCVKVI